MSAELSKRFWEATRGKVLGLLRTGPRSVEELARDPALTDNAIRTYFATLERDGLVTQQEVMGVPVRQCSEQGPSPRCCFTVSSAA